MGEGYYQTPAQAVTRSQASSHGVGGEEGPEFRPAAAGVTDIAGEEVTSLCTAGCANPTSLSGGKYHSAKIFMKREK